MSKNDEILIKETNNNSQSKIWKRIIAILFIFSGIVGLMTCFYLMTQLFINHQQLLELSFLEYSFKPGFEILAYSSSIFVIAGFLALMLAAGVDLFFEASKEIRGYIPLFISAIFFILSFGLWFVSHEPGSKWWTYFCAGYLGIDFITTVTCEPIGSDRKNIYTFLVLSKYILIITMFFFLLLNNINWINT